MNDNNPIPQQPEESVYQTGRTQPNKNHGGIITVGLMLLILLGGTSVLLEMMNIRLFPEEVSDLQADSSPLSFSICSTAGRLNDGTQEQSMQVNINDSPASWDNVPQADGLPLQQIYKDAINSVVSISCQMGSGTSSGTGVVVTADGYLVTNAHVIANAESILVQLSDQRSYYAYIAGTDPLTDLAVLYIPAKDLVPAKFGDSSALQVGDAVVAIGDPLGSELRGTMTDGIVSAINRSITSGGHTLNVIQTNAALNPGNSGGPLLNCYGQVVGINTMKIGKTYDSSHVEGLGFAIPSTTVKEVVDQLLLKGYVSGRPTLGFSGITMSALERRYYRLPTGLYITSVDKDSNAYQVGIRPGDTLLQFNQEPVTSTENLQELLYAMHPGDEVQLVVYRSGRRYAVQITIQEAR